MQVTGSVMGIIVHYDLHQSVGLGSTPKNSFLQDVNNEYGNNRGG